MLLAFAFCHGSSAPPELCLIPLKPDQFSVMVPVDRMLLTESAVLRLSPFEAVKVKEEKSEKAIIIEPVIPSKLFITPSQPDRPGVSVKGLKIRKSGERLYETWFKEESREGQWKPWNPNTNEQI